MSIAIAGFAELSPQQVFDMAVAHIATTRKQSRRPIPNSPNLTICCYTGIGCAASVFLKPELRQYADSLEMGWEEMADQGEVSPAHRMLVNDLQQAHDQADEDEFMADWKSRMMTVADIHSLDTVKLKAVEV